MSQQLTVTCIRDGMLKDEYIGEASLEVEGLVDETVTGAFSVDLKENDFKTG